MDDGKLLSTLEYLLSAFAGVVARVEGLRGRNSAFEPRRRRAAPVEASTGCLRVFWLNPLTADGRRWTIEKPRSMVCRPRSAFAGVVALVEGLCSRNIVPFEELPLKARGSL